MGVAAIIVAGGRGERVGAGTPKQFLDLGGGRTMLDMSIDAMLACPRVDEVVVAVPPAYVDRLKTPARVRAVPGGARRQDSMANALASVSAGADVVLVHDAARPFVSVSAVEAVIEAASAHGAAILALPVRDTVKLTAEDSGGRVVRDTLRREDIYLAQTPQAFRRDLLVRALDTGGGADVTDDAMLVERAGHRVHVVPGEPGNVKITTAEDLARVRAMQTRPERQTEPRARQRVMRVGTGYDLHRLVPGRPLVLAGVRIPFETGLLGHSDADIVCHAVTDAILGASALGDIGRLFPDTDPRWKDADSLQLLRAAAEVIARAGWRVANVDVTVVAERPKLLPHLPTMRANLAAALGIDEPGVSVKGKTNEQMDAAGRGEAMACHAVALIAYDPSDAAPARGASVT